MSGLVLQGYGAAQTICTLGLGLLFVGKFFYHGEMSGVGTIPTWEWEPDPDYPFDELVGSQFKEVHYEEAQYVVGDEPQRMGWDAISEACALITGHRTAPRYVQSPCYYLGEPGCYVKKRFADSVRMMLHSTLREGLVKAFFKLDKGEQEEMQAILDETESQLEQICEDFREGAESIDWEIVIYPEARKYVVEVIVR